MRAAFAFTVLAIASAALAEPVKKPPVPPGVDPGGVLIAIIGEGVDYTKTEIAARLARDGEGEIIGWDFIDNDRRPYADGSWVPNNGPLAAGLFLEQSSKSKLAVFRTPVDDPASLVRAIAMAGQTRAAIVVMAAADTTTSSLLATISGKLKDQLIVVAASASSNFEASALANMLIVAPCMPAKETCVRSQKLSDAVEILAPFEFYSSEHVSGVPVNNLTAWPIDTAARIAALAARMLAVEPGLTGAELKSRIVALAKPSSEGEPKPSHYGIIEDPAAHFTGK